MPIEPSQPKQAARRHILLIEDDPMVVRMYKRKFDQEGYEVSLAFNGQEGLEVLKRKRPDIVLLDIMMPKLSGIDTLKIIKSDPQYADLPVVMLTNLGDRAQDTEKCKELGAEDYWVKANMRLDEVVSNIERIFSRRAGLARQ
jgi:DNA-binding response OmpR family regulator